MPREKIKKKSIGEKNETEKGTKSA
jgi:hypothetical protein